MAPRTRRRSSRSGAWARPRRRRPVNDSYGRTTATFKKRRRTGAPLRTSPNRSAGWEISCPATRQRDPEPERRTPLTSLRWLIAFLFVGVSTLLLAHRAEAQLSYFPLTPCRLADTRLPVGPYGGPAL